MAPALSVSIITLNPGDFLRYCLSSIAGHVDEIVIVDSGSKDNTKSIAEEFGAKFVLCSHDTHPDWFLWDEETAQWFMGREDLIRQLSFDESSCDYRMWIDSDDQVIGAEHLRTIVQNMQERDLDVGWLFYDYARYKNGKVALTLERERIVRKGVSRWMYASHSVHGGQDVPTTRQAMFSDVRIDHCHGDAAHLSGNPGPRPNNRGYKALWAYHVAMNGDSPVRDLFYMGREILPVDQNIAFQWFEEVLKHPDANPVQRACSYFHMAKIHEMRGDLKAAYETFVRALNVKLAIGEYMEARYCAARLAHKLGSTNTAKRHLKAVISKGHDRSVIPCDPSVVSNSIRVYQALQQGHLTA